MNRQSFMRTIAIIVVFVLGTTLTPADASAQAGPDVVASGLNGPMGVLAAPDGSVWVVDSGIGGDEEMEFPNVQTYAIDTVAFGNTSRVIRIDADGAQTEIATLPSIALGTGEVIGGARLAMLNGSVYVTSAMWMVGGQADRGALMASVAKLDNGVAKEVANIFEIEGKTNPDGRVVESNPYGLTAGPDGMLWVADAGANTVLRVDPTTGETKMVAYFEELPSPIPNPGHDNKMETDPVPTAVAFDAAGKAYVSLLSGFPFVPGSAKVVQVSEQGEVSDYATGLTMLVDLRTGPDGNMYAVSMGQFTDQGPVPNSGTVVRIKAGDSSEEIVTGLSFPTSIDFSKNGDAYVTTNGLGAPGSGEIIRYPGLAKP